MDRLTRKSDTSDMVWFIDCEHKGYTESGYFLTREEAEAAISKKGE